VRLDSAYTPAYLQLARLYRGQEGRGPAVGRLLRHVARLEPNSPDHLAEVAAWLLQQGKTYCSLLDAANEMSGIIKCNRARLNLIGFPLIIYVTTS
jgi:hypothetical protein